MKTERERQDLIAKPVQHNADGSSSPKITSTIDPKDVAFEPKREAEPMEHTPGPWIWDEEDGSIETSDGFTICHVQHHGSINTVNRTGQQYSHADARLIASAPQMRKELDAHQQAMQAAQGYLSRLLKSLAPQCEPLDDLLGVCTQLDNWCAGAKERDRCAALVEEEMESELTREKQRAQALEAWVRELTCANRELRAINVKPNVTLGLIQDATQRADRLQEEVAGLKRDNERLSDLEQVIRIHVRDWAQELGHEDGLVTVKKLREMVTQQLAELRAENAELKKHQIPQGWICHP